MQTPPQSFLIQNATLINEGKMAQQDVLIQAGCIAKIGPGLRDANATVIDATGHYLLPGVIDGQVHFRDPGLTHKGDLHTESRAAIAGGVTSFIDMPNTVPNTLTREALHQKYALGAEKSWANYGSFMGISAGNREEALAADKEGILALSDDGLYFNGKGNLIVQNPGSL